MIVEMPAATALNTAAEATRAELPRVSELSVGSTGPSAIVLVL